ncbi:MAG: Holliday junction branch migration protein RuvA [Patescibacteria group bacterium]|nr:Holliday junction branch migration protein RuvA [Patescibacteria group bacterium]
MIAYLKGNIVELGQGYVVVKMADGVGYKVQILEKAELWKSIADGAEIELFTSQYFRENDQGLFGFPTSQERNFFELLITVSGVGPKLAATMLSHIKVGTLAQMLINENVVGIIKVPGIGKKIAERLIIDLRDKVFGVEGTDKGEGKRQEQHQSDVDFLSQALAKLGFSNSETNKMLENVDDLLGDGNDIEDVLGMVLKGRDSA